MDYKYKSLYVFRILQPWRGHGRYRSLLRLLSIGLLALVCNPVNADLILSAPPRENPEEGKKIYGPIADYLTEVLGETVRYEHPGVWAKYSADMREGKYDIVFDAPHFGAWRIKNIHHVPVVKLPGKMQFIIIANSADTPLNTMRDLLGVKICALASPNLGTVTVYNMFDNPVFQPELYEVKGGFKKVYEGLLSGKCRAAVLRDNLYYNLDEKEKALVKVVARSKPVPEQTITISDRLSSKKKFITEKLISSSGVTASKNLLHRFGRDAKQFETANEDEYKDLDNLLTGVVWGW